jgi:hypothetical protein
MDGNKVIAVQIGLGPSASEDELDVLTRKLRAELEHLDIRSADLVKSNDLPEGAKAVEWATLGAIVVQFVSSHALGQVVGAVRGWLERGPDRQVAITVGDRSIVLSDPTKSQQQALVDLWLKETQRSLDARDLASD